MTRIAMVAVAAAVIALAAVVGFRFLPSDGGTGVGDQPTPSPAPSPAPTPSAVISPPPLTDQYMSSIHGMTVSYPAGWLLRPATEPWVSGWLIQDSPGADVIVSRWRGDRDAFIAIASQPLNGKTAEEWTDHFLALGSAEKCGPPEPHTVDGVEGVITDCDDGPHAIVVSNRRAYVVWLYSIEDPAYFDEILATVQLDPTPTPTPRSPAALQRPDNVTRILSIQLRTLKG